MARNNSAESHSNHINLIIKVLIYSDFLILSAFGFINPTFAVFITEKIPGAGLEVVGYAATILLVIKSIVQLPIAKYVDRKKGEKDDLYFVIVGSFLISITPFLYIRISEVWHLYLLQAIYGIGGAMGYPTWFALFTRHVDRYREGFEWGIYNTVAGLGVGLTAALGGVFAQRFGFDVVYILCGIIAIFGSALLLLLRRHIIEQDRNNGAGSQTASKSA